MCAELRTVAASNNRDHPTRSLSSSPLASTINCSPGSQALWEVTHQDHSIEITLLLLVRATYIMVLFFTHIPFVLNRTINATPPERLQQHERTLSNYVTWKQRPIVSRLENGWYECSFMTDNVSSMAYKEKMNKLLEYGYAHKWIPQHCQIWSKLGMPHHARHFFREVPKLCMIAPQDT